MRMQNPTNFKGVDSALWELPFRKHFPSTFFKHATEVIVFCCMPLRYVFLFLNQKKNSQKKQGKYRKQSANYIFHLLTSPFSEALLKQAVHVRISALCSPYARVPAHGWSLAEGPSSWKFQTLDTTPHQNGMSSMTFTYQRSIILYPEGFEDHLFK